jgi:hypothetical protein
MELPVICEVILTVQLRSLLPLPRDAEWQIVSCIHNTKAMQKWWRNFEDHGINEQQQALKAALVVSIEISITSGQVYKFKLSALLQVY